MFGIQDDTSEKQLVFWFFPFASDTFRHWRKYIVSVRCYFTESLYLVKYFIIQINNFHRSLDGFPCFFANRNSAFANGLAARGHNVTIISADRDKNPPNGVHYIQAEGLYNEYYDETVKDAFIPIEPSPFQWINEFTDRMVLTCEGDTEDWNVFHCISFVRSLRISLIFQTF